MFQHSIFIEHLLYVWHQARLLLSRFFCKLGENPGEQVNKKRKMIVLNAMKERKQGKGREWSEKTCLWR